MVFEYTIDADEKYEDWMHINIFSNELIHPKEFEKITEKAINILKEENKQIDWISVGKKIVEIDNKFFFSEPAHCAIIRNEKLKRII